MPCWTIVTNTVRTENMQIELLVEGLKAADFSVRHSLQRKYVQFSKHGQSGFYQEGSLTVYGEGQKANEIADEVKRAYAAQTIRYATAKFGWKANEKKTTRGVEFAVSKRR